MVLVELGWQEMAETWKDMQDIQCILYMQDIPTGSQDESLWVSTPERLFHQSMFNSITGLNNWQFMSFLDSSCPAGRITKPLHMKIKLLKPILFSCSSISTNLLFTHFLSWYQRHILLTVICFMILSMLFFYHINMICLFVNLKSMFQENCNTLLKFSFNNIIDVNVLHCQVRELYL